MIAFFLCLFYTLLFIWLIHRLRFFDAEGLSKKMLSIIFAIKVFFGICLWIIYTYYYTDRSTADIYKYFDDSKVMFDALLNQPLDYLKMLTGIGNNEPCFDVYYSKMNHWHREFDSNLYNDSHTIIRFNALVRLFSFGYFNVHTVFINFFSLLGLVALYKTFLPYFKEKTKTLILCLFFIPSVLFWGSGVLKEGIIFFALGLLMFYVNRLLKEKKSFYSVVCICFAVLLLLHTKFYILVSILPGMIAYHWALKKNNQKLILKYLFVFIAFAAVGISVDKLFPGYDPLEVLVIKQRDFINVADGSVVVYNDSVMIKIETDNRTALIKQTDTTYQLKQGSSYIYWRNNNMGDTLLADNSTDTSVYKLLWDMPKVKNKIAVNRLEPTLWSFISNAPMAFYHTLIRPYIFEANSVLMIFSAGENIVFLLLIIMALIYRKPFNQMDLNLFLFCISFVVFLYVIIGITTPVIGAAVRYKTPALPFLAMALLLMMDVEKIKKQSPFLKRLLF